MALVSAPLRDWRTWRSPTHSLRNSPHREPLGTMPAFAHLRQYLARKKKTQSISETLSDQLPQENESFQYHNVDYELRLEQRGSYMGKSAVGVIDTSRDLCQLLLEERQEIPQDTLFRDDLFDETCESVQGKNKAMIVRDITPLICPSAQVFRIRGAKNPNHIFESINERWSSMAEFEGSLPQPDYSVGCGRSAFTQEQLNRLRPFVGEPGYKVTTYFMATAQMYFPFLTCEVKRGTAALDVADRQNAQNMSLAMRAFVVLFQWVKREKELNRQILAFSISHDHKSVRIYDHYPVIEGDKANFYRHPIREFSFTEQDGKEKWTAYKFVKNVYDHYSPKIHRLLCSGIDDLPIDITVDPPE